MRRTGYAGYNLEWGHHTAKVMIPAFYLPRRSMGFDLILPLWIPEFLLVAATILLVRGRHEPIPEHPCKKCGYDLTGNLSGTCPVHRPVDVG